MQFLAMLTMLIDHIGLLWFPESSAWRIVGRLALPFYAFTMVLGYFRTRDVKRYLRRVAWIAVLSQLPYQFAFDRLEVNTVGSLFVCLLLLRLLDQWKGKQVLQVIAAAGFAAILEFFPFSYGAYIVLLVLIYRYAQIQWFALFHFSLNVVSFFIKGWFLQAFSLFATFLIVYWPGFIRSADKIKVPRLVWRSFYPLHLAVLAIIYHLTSNQVFIDILRAL
ncbi:hypothetical protein FHS16_003418 [Paenibacillus endophyticus]|uniref:Conjugal transfer protein TraX n=1 Tax=Paenibacillus endophyticus TaxID=1294268 RepID=A0A7W5GB27_9BACL|nr:TraX family protein [Paenibacillus endophyticus]MBB3153356.1 hypothetical protein [Paenibacillus endophyticus]